MFDNVRSETPARSGPDENLERLCAVYDRLLETSGTELSPTEAAELAAMANIFDLDAGREPRLVWADLRAVLMRQATAETESVEPAEPLTILIAEDDAATAADLMHALIEAGHRVVGPFHNAEAALGSAALHPVDLALLDINLSEDGAGVDLARRLKESWGVPAIFLSGDVTTAARNAGLAAALVMKPYTGRAVLNAIASVRRAEAAA